MLSSKYHSRLEVGSLKAARMPYCGEIVDPQDVVWTMIKMMNEYRENLASRFFGGGHSGHS
ncbi:hypothetical protein EMIT0P44_70141 [Pseudomonas sp. IT-P44]